MNKHIAAEIKIQVTQLLKQFMAKELDEKQLIDALLVIHNAHKEGNKTVWYKWHSAYPLAITIWDIKTGINNVSARKRGFMYECIEATINDNSLVVNFS